MSQDIYVARKSLLQKRIGTPLALLLLTLLLSVGLILIKERPAQACHPDVCPDGGDWVKDESSPFAHTFSGDGEYVCEVCVKGGQIKKFFSEDGSDGCWQVSGIGTQTASAQNVGGCCCPDISHASFRKCVREPSPTPPPCCPPEEDCPTECHTDTVYVDDGDCGQKECLPNAPAAEACPIECGYSGGTVPDGNCGTISCPATDPCITPTPTPTETEDRGEPGPASPPVCGAATPDAPYLVSATAIGGNQVKLVWQKVANATHYTISYGPSSGDYPWGVPNTGDTDNFTIGGLSSGCFIVYAVNDCAPSGPSNEVCTGQVLGQVLGLSATSGDSTNTVSLWAGVASLLLGSLYLTQGLSTIRLDGRRK